MIDLHTHSLFSDGALIPSELVYRAKFKGYDTIAVTDHGDFSNIDFVVPRIKRVAIELTLHYDILVIPGVEITYVPPKLISKAVKLARLHGAKIVVVHGETPVETVPAGTNLAGILSGADILAHPGHITEEEVRLAQKNNVCLEITTRNGHNITNPHVAALAKKLQVNLVLNTDTHEPEDLFTKEKVDRILKIAGLTKKDYDKMLVNSHKLTERRK